MDKRADYKRSKVHYKQGKGAIEITVTASDPVALLASLTGAIKQLRIIAGIDRTAAKLTAGSSSD
jgi:tRNA threonylcarbamoyladenosine modification (KEOPS) complex  Pcc1 subunit